MEKQIDSFLLNYFEKNLKKGYKIDDLRLILINQKYVRSDIDKAIGIIKEKIKKAQVEKEKRERKLIEEKPMEIVEETKKGFFGRLFGN